MELFYETRILMIQVMRHQTVFEPVIDTGSLTGQHITGGSNYYYNDDISIYHMTFTILMNMM